MVNDLEQGYSRWLTSLLHDSSAALYVAEKDGEVIGYAAGRIEPRDWITLIDRHGALHEVYVTPERRGQGAGRDLIRAVCARLRELGAPRVVLWSAWQNQAAHRLFESVGFRRTMLEMTLELG